MSTPDRIIEAALRLFSRQGFSAVSTRALAREAECNLATLNYHFGSKKGVYEATVERVYARIGDAAAEIGASLPSASIRDSVGVVVDFARREDDVLRLLLREVLDHGRMTPETESEHFLPALGHHATWIANAFDTSPTRARALLVSGGFLLSRFATQDDSSLRDALGLSSTDAVRDTVVDILTTFAQSMLRT